MHPEALEAVGGLTAPPKPPSWFGSGAAHPH